jgi:holin-like protein
MLACIAVFLLLQIIGESISLLLNLPIPGAVLGMVMMLICLILKYGLIEEVRPTANILLAHLALLFVPAGIGIIRQTERITSEWLAITLVIVLGTAITMLVTAFTIQWTAKYLGVDDDTE